MNDWTRQDADAGGGAGAAGTLEPVYTRARYTYRQRVLTLLGSRVDVFDRYPNVVLHCHQKAFRLREDIRLYSDQQQSREMLAIAARNILDFRSAYDVIDRTNGQFVGTLRRRGWTSLVRDEWEILDAQQQPLGRIVEDSLALALLRRILTNLIPQAFHFEDSSGTTVAHARQHFNPFVQWLDLEILPFCRIDPRLLIAATTLLVVIEGRSE